MSTRRLFRHSIVEAMRVILFTGKSGVGKTSVAAATVLHAAELDYRTIILSTDAAHSLSDSFEVPLSNEPRLIIPNLWGQETELSQTLETQWGEHPEISVSATGLAGYR